MQRPMQMGNKSQSQQSEFIRLIVLSIGCMKFRLVVIVWIESWTMLPHVRSLNPTCSQQAFTSPVGSITNAFETLAEHVPSVSVGFG